MIRKKLNKFLPNVDKLREQKALGIFGEHLFHPALWHLNRRSVAGGLAVGLFCGLIPGPLQMAGAAVGALWLRINLPVALATTLYTNPFTIVPLYLIAYRLGTLVLPGGTSAIPPAPVLSANIGASLASISEWASSLGTPLLVGVPLLAALLALAGYLTVRITWGMYLRLAWRQRRLRRA